MGTDQKKKIESLERRLPLLWESYKHMHDVREGKAKGMIDFLLIVSTFLPLLLVTLYTTKLFGNLLILLPIIPQIASIVILLKYFVVGNPSVHWFKLDKNFLKGLKNGGFECNLILALKKLEGDTYISMLENSKIIRYSRDLILSSLFFSILSILFILLNGSFWLYMSIVILIILSYSVYFVYYRKMPNFSKEDKNLESNRKLLEDWLNENTTK